MKLYNYHQLQVFALSPFHRFSFGNDVVLYLAVLSADFQCPFCNGLFHFQVVLLTFVSFESFRSQLGIFFAEFVEGKNKIQSTMQ